MQLSLNWLKDFVEIPKSITAEELGLRLTMHTVEIDSVEKQADKFKNIVVGKIIEIKKHPNADKLQLVEVDIGKDKLNIICGAPNIEVGQFVPLALVGAELSNGIEIKETEIRGAKSCGMLCAEDELGLGSDHSGILILEKNARIGQNLGEYLKLKDVIFVVDNKSITHRPDLWGHYGMAREIAVFLSTKFKPYKPDKKLLLTGKAAKPKVKVDDFSLCPRYMAVTMDKIKIEPSPKWIQDRLMAAGVRPINNIVDVTNYVLLELGQPLHAFDRNLVDEIIVRRAKKDEIMETLDGEKRALDEDMLVIADSRKAIAVAGVMGGANSEISSDTTSIIIESANFDYISNRKTAQKLGLRTEASMRYEKALDPNLCEIALIRAVELIKKLCPQARVASNLADEKKFKLNQGPIELNLDWLNKSIGDNIKEKEVIEILECLGFEVEKNKKILRVTVPTWRATRDISIEEDLVEEVARIYGFNNLKPNMPKVEMKKPIVNEERELERKIRNILVGGPALIEVYNYSFVNEELLKKLGIDFSNYIRLANPIASHLTMLRQSLIPNLILNVKTNQARFNRFGLFEIGSIYSSIDGEINKDDQNNDKLPYQEKHLGIVVVGNKKDNVFSQAKGMIEYLLTFFDLEIVFSLAETVPNWAQKKITADILVLDKNIGSVFMLDSQTGSSLGLKKDVAIIEISLKDFYNLAQEKGERQFKEYEKYPPVIRDLAFVVNENILYNDIRKEIVNYHEFVKQVELFDVYQGEKLGRGKKNLAFHIIYQADKTLTSQEIDKLQKGLIKALERKFEAKIRDF